jgi:hypothetical protein
MPGATTLLYTKSTYFDNRRQSGQEVFAVSSLWTEDVSKV